MFTSLLIKTQHLRIIWKIKGLSTLDAYASRHGMDPFGQIVKLSVIA